MEEMCAQFPNKGYIGDPTDCTKWGYCRSQQLVAWGSCGDGLVYDAATSTCDYATKVACSTSVSKTCAALKTTGYMADPTNCANYAYCFGNGTSATRSCPTGQNYAANNNSCVWGPSCPQDTICRFMPTNIFVGDPTTCGQYVSCINGYGVPSACNPIESTAYYFNVVTGSCQKTNPCDTNGNDNNGNSGTVTAPTPKDDLCGSVTEPTYFSDGESCSGYFYCKDTEDTGTWGLCPLGTAFDADLQKCVSPASIACEADRCANTNLTFAAIYNTECKGYTICSTGAKADCPEKYPYYDEVYNKCVEKSPDYVICQPID
ncbi:hypothetical protein KR222_009262 [Zaprionus bogoriensis]|nr:hypothetical protein KR222_009262 [Zaprionus bogoriensis]